MFKKLCILFMLIGVLFLASSSYAIPVTGSSSGIFINPAGPGGMFTTGAGTDHFTWGTGPSWLDFSGNSFSVETGEVFGFGTISFHNGANLVGTSADNVDLDVTLSFTSLSGLEQDFSYNLGLINTLNTYDPYASADFVTFPSSIPHTFITTGGMNYTLEFLGFGNISGSGFSTVNSFHVLEGKGASAELLGRVTASSVPEPATILLLGSGLFGVIALRKRIKKN